MVFEKLYSVQDKNNYILFYHTCLNNIHQFISDKSDLFIKEIDSNDVYEQKINDLNSIAEANI